jgi:hypothetical protein
MWLIRGRDPDNHLADPSTRFYVSSDGVENAEA